MKKLILFIVLLCSLSAISQTNYGYTYIGQRYEWLGGLFKALGLPAGSGPAAFVTGQHQRAGAIYYDSLGIDAGVYIWDGVTWNLLTGGGGSGTAGEGLFVSGDSMHLGTLVSGTGALFNQDRYINVNRKGMYWTNGTISDLVDPGGVSWGFGQEVFSPFQFLTRDTVPSNDVDPPTAAVPFSGLYARRQIVYPGPSVFRTQKVFGHTLETNWLYTDTLSLNTQSGDWNAGVVIKNVYDPQGTGRQGIRASHGTNQNNSIAYAAPVVLGVIQLRNTPSNWIKVDGHLSGFNSYYVSSSNNNDTLKGLVFYTTGAFYNGLVNKVYDFAPTARFAPPFADSVFGWWDTIKVKYQHFGGKTVLGPSKGTVFPWSSSDALRVLGNIYITDSAKLGKSTELADSTGVDFLVRRRSDSTVFRVRPDHIPGASPPTLQAVVNVGSSTTTSINFNSGAHSIYNTTGGITFDQGSGNTSFFESGTSASRYRWYPISGVNYFDLDGSLLTTTRRLYYPDEADTIATRTWARVNAGGAGSGANVALSNLAGVAVNTTIASDADNTDDLGTSTFSWKDIYTRTVKFDGATSGTVTLNSDALSNAMNATVLSGTGYVPTCFEARQTSNFTGVSQNTVQPVFETAQDVFTAQASTTYDFEAVYLFSHGAVSHSVGLSFELAGGCTLTSITYSTLGWVTAVGTQTSSQTSNVVQVATNVAMNAAGANATENIIIKGSISVNAGGTITPSYTFSTAPTGTVLTLTGSYIKFCPKGTNTYTSIGPFN